MAKELTYKEQLTQEREARHRMIQKASAGDSEARETLAAAPYRLRVFTPEEREAYIQEHKE